MSELITNKKLDNLLIKDCIKSYKLVNVDENGKVNKISKSRNTQRLILTFANSEKLTIDTMCSGCSQDTILFIS